MPYVVIAHGAEITLPDEARRNAALGDGCCWRDGCRPRAGEYLAAACIRTAG